MDRILPFSLLFEVNQKTERLYKKKKKPCQGVEARKYTKNAKNQKYKKLGKSKNGNKTFKRLKI
ncbi:hypothetical protein CQA40_04890 [Helicobacter sp. MIT 01-3238]|nr:hypothetical protein CQA40_04890 [Helicobacter sp. MIT 01-3238]